jgi:cell division protein ZapA (FtsZ GTPase activity inhibitor)
MGESVSIEIMGQKFFIKDTHDKKYIDRVEKYINEKIDEVKGSGNASINTYNMMVLVALNLVDDCFNKEIELKQLHEKIEERSNNLIEFIDSKM